MTGRAPSPIELCPRCGAEFALEFKGQWWETSQLCSECGVASDAAPVLRPSEDECEYPLGDSAVADRVAMTAALTDLGIAYRWEQGRVLVVPATARQRVEGLLDGVSQDRRDSEPAAAGIDDGDDGGEEAHAAMQALFLAADRLQHRPRETVARAELMEAADAAATSLPPYGIDHSLWRRVQALASSVVIRLDESAGDEAVAADARALRDTLRGYI